METLLTTGGVGGEPIVSTIVPTPDDVAMAAPLAFERLTSKVRLA